MSIILAPIICGLIIGFIVGTRINTNIEGSIKLTGGAIVLIILVAILMAWNLGQLPYYGDLPVSSGFISAVIGLIIGSLLFGKYAKGDHE